MNVFGLEKKLLNFLTVFYVAKRTLLTWNLNLTKKKCSQYYNLCKIWKFVLMAIENANENQKLHLRLLLYVAQSCHKIPCLDEVVSQAKKCFRIMRLHRALRLRETIYQLKIFCVELLEEKRFIWQNLSPFHNIQYFFCVLVSSYSPNV